MNFSKMSGYEFEDFIANLLRQKGFKVTQTDYSNDGGVDLIAEYFKPLFSGKYIVQCKNYTNNLVGQPELRDLYGVVMSEKANKGILITTSDFTTQAKNFAKDKNLELINGSVLNSLIEGVDIKVEEPQLKFFEMPEFDKKTYELLRKRQKARKRKAEGYLELFYFFNSYIVNDEYKICKSGLIDEYHKVIEEGDINLDYSWVSNFDTGLYPNLYFVEGNLAQATKELIEENFFYFSEYPSFLSLFDYTRKCCGKVSKYDEFNPKNYSWTNIIKLPSFLSSYSENDLNEMFKMREKDSFLSKLKIPIFHYCFETRCFWGYSYKLALYSTYKQIGFEEGCAEMIKNIKIPKLIKDFSFDELSEHPYFYNLYHNYIELEIKSYNEFLNGAFDNIFNPIWHDKYYKKSDQEIISEIKEVFKKYNITVE